HRADDPEHDADGQEHQRHRAGTSRQVPVGAGAQGRGEVNTHRTAPEIKAGSPDGRSSPAPGHPARWQTVPSTPTSRLGSPSSESHATDRAPRMIAAVLAMLASRHEAAHTLTVRHTLSTESPVEGSIRWWATPESVRHRRTATLEVA